jgi:hypothetical protein
MRTPREGRTLFDRFRFFDLAFKVVGAGRVGTSSTVCLFTAATDGFLGRTRGLNGRDAYVRQLRDMKVSAVVEGADIKLLRNYARMCAHALARAYARSGDAAMISGYMGSAQTSDDAIGEFAVEYADQNSKDYGAFVRAIREKRIEATVEV